MTEKLLARVAAVAAIGAVTAGITPGALAMASTGQAGIHVPITRGPYALTPETDADDPKDDDDNSGEKQDPEKTAWLADDSQENQGPATENDGRENPRPRKKVRLNENVKIREFARLAAPTARISDGEKTVSLKPDPKS